MPGTDQVATEPPGGDAEVWVTQRAGADLVRKDYDTIRRWRRGGKLGRSRKGASGEIEVPLSDLVAAAGEDVRQVLAGGDVAEIASRSRAERELIAVRQELAVTCARLEAEAARAARAEGEVAFLRRQLVARGAR